MKVEGVLHSPILMHTNGDLKPFVCTCLVLVLVQSSCSPKPKAIYKGFTVYIYISSKTNSWLLIPVLDADMAEFEQVTWTCLNGVTNELEVEPVLFCSSGMTIT